MSDDVETYELREDIDQTRDSMSETISQLEERLAPERLQQDTSEIVREVADKIVAEFQGKTDVMTQQFADQIQSAIHGVATAKSEELLTHVTTSMRSIGSALWERVGSSPTPAALAAVGIGLLAAGAKSLSPTSGGANGAGGTDESGLKETLDGLLTKASAFAEGAMESVSAVGEKSSNLVAQAKDTATGASTSGHGPSGNFVTDQPLVTALLALGLGAAIGLTMPETAKEREATSSLRSKAEEQLSAAGIASTPSGMMAQAKDGLGALASKVTDAASASITEAKQSASEIASTAKDTASDAARDRGLTH